MSDKPTIDLDYESQRPRRNTLPADWRRRAVVAGIAGVIVFALTLEVSRRRIGKEITYNDGASDALNDAQTLQRQVDAYIKETGQIPRKLGDVPVIQSGSLQTIDPFRRRGIGRAVLGRMLSDDRAAGAKSAVLLASHTGAKLYASVGYEQIGMLLLFTPKKR